ncbi:MAG TPA: SpoIIE family protein phosphatase [Solirubrobacterales bacterium]|nr:SpoIIE family protein phosphatase [Solirubrobacterales bacterium]
MQGEMSNAARLVWVCASALAVFVAWVATSAGPNTGIGFFYAVPIGLAAWWGGIRNALIAVAGCVVLYNLGALIQPVPHFGLALLLRLIVFLAVAILVSVARERLAALEHSAEELEDIQAALTPTKVIDIPHVEVGTAFVPSDHGVSGDFYLVTNGPDGSTLAIVGDVVGHGPQAARLATFIRARFAAFVASTSEPGELLSLANIALLDRPGASRELVSAACLRFREGGDLSWAIAGHPPPLRLPRLEELAPVGPTFLLGADAELELHAGHTLLNPGEGALIYTDGATEIRRDGKLLGFEGLSRLLGPLSPLAATDLASRAEAALLDWTDEALRDDLCLLVVKPKRS